MKNLNKVVKTLENSISSNVFKNVNSGGCGAFAVAIHNALAAYGIDSTIHLVNHSMRYTKSGVEELIKTLEAENINHAYTILMDRNGRSDINNMCGHACVMVNGILYDGEGMYFGEAISDPIHVNVMGRMVRDDRFWNRTFLYANTVSGFNNNGARSLIEVVSAVQKHVLEKVKLTIEG